LNLVKHLERYGDIWGSKSFFAAVRNPVGKGQSEHQSTQVEITGIPYILRACDEPEGEFEQFLKGMPGFGRILQFFGQNQLFILQLLDLLFIGGGDRRAGRRSPALSSKACG